MDGVICPPVVEPENTARAILLIVGNRVDERRVAIKIVGQEFDVRQQRIFDDRASSDCVEKLACVANSALIQFSQ